MAEASPEHLNESVLFYEEGPVAGTQDIRSNKGSARGKIFRINPFNRTSEIKDQFNPASVAYNPIANEWLVAWADGTDDLVFVRRVAANGTPIGTEHQISSGNGTDIETTVPVFSPEANEYLVVWKGDSSSVGR